MQNFYRDRDNVWAKIDAVYLHSLNTSSELCATAFTGCLDAPEHIPSGSTKQFSVANKFFSPTPGYAVRGMSVEELAERERLAEILINQLIKEMENEDKQ
jgi:hypothetical protein